MTYTSIPALTIARKLVLAACALAAVTAPVLYGLLHAPAIHAQSTQAEGLPSPVLESISIKPHPVDGQWTWSYPNDNPDHFRMTNCTVAALIGYAYGVHDFQISKAPAWVRRDTFDIEAELSASGAAAMRKLTPMQQIAEKKLIAQSILADRFQLELAAQTEDRPAYLMEVAAGGAKLMPPIAPRVAPDGEEIISQQVLVQKDLQKINVTGPVSTLADVLGDRLHQIVVDQTGLTGTYEMPLAWAAGAQEDQNLRSAVETLGLILTPRNQPVEILTIHQVAHPDFQSAGL